MKRAHILICGERGVGKSMLIRRLLEANTRPVYGFYTERLRTPNAEGFFPIYLHPARTEREYGVDNYLGSCDSRRRQVNLEVFNGLGCACLKAPADGLIVMDELGFMEAEATDFVQGVLQALDGDVPVIASVKARMDVAFLQAVRAHPKATLFMIDEHNREALYELLLDWILKINR